MLVPRPVSAAGTFVDTSSISVIAAFPQNYLTNVRPGDRVEMVLDVHPGTIFRGRVDTVIPASGGGQLTTSGEIPSAAKATSNGLFAVKTRFESNADPQTLAMGSGGTVAIYTNKGKPVHIISKVALRMKKWLLYVVPSAQKS
jgi:multidrug resistance efflux pump